MPWLPRNSLPFGALQSSVLIALVIALVLLVLLLLLLLLRVGRAQRRHAGPLAAPDRGSPARSASAPQQASAAGRSAGPSVLSEAELTTELRRRLAGLPAGDALDPGVGTVDQVVWVADGDEVLVHLESLHVRLLDRIVLVSVDLEADETGRQTLVVPLALAPASGAGAGGLVAVTEEAPRGDPALVARWGRTLQEAVWASLLALAGDHAAARGHTPSAISAAPGQLLLHSAAPALAPARALEPTPARVR